MAKAKKVNPLENLTRYFRSLSDQPMGIVVPAEDWESLIAAISGGENVCQLGSITVTSQVNVKNATDSRAGNRTSSDYGLINDGEWGRRKNSIKGRRKSANGKSRNLNS